MKIRGNTVGTNMKPERVVEVAGGGSGGSISAKVVDNVLVVTVAGLSASIKNGVLVVA